MLTAPPRNLAVLAIELGRLGLLGFGGVGPQAYHVFVERCRWLSADDFADRLSIAQALPGANVVNLCAIVGDAWFGLPGAVVAVTAITVPPLAIALIAAATLARFAHAPRLVGAECGIVAASAGLVAATAWRVGATVRRRRIAALVLTVLVAATILTHLLSMPLAAIAAVVAGTALDRWRSASE